MNILPSGNVYDVGELSICLAACGISSKLSPRHNRRRGGCRGCEWTSASSFLAATFPTPRLPGVFAIVTTCRDLLTPYVLCFSRSIGHC